MLNLLWLIPTLPFTGFLVLTVAGSRLSRKAIAIIGVGSIGISAFTSLSVAVNFLFSPPPGYSFHQLLWNWLNVAGFKASIAFHLDALSIVFILVITFVGFLIHLYSSEFMWEDEGYSRFFAYMNLFIGSMLILVLADNLLLLYLGWEGVGLCSYLLIGFWYKDARNGYAARKAFVVTRVGDTAMAVGLFILLASFSTLDISELMQQVPEHWTTSSEIAVLTTALLLAGALGKSAQLPLQTWLPDAMAGPTPVSALIHAATMVTAGVYLIARLHVVFTLAPQVQAAIAIIGAVTLLVAGFSALAQSDIKRVLAYSTISQIGYMFLALGVGAWSAAVFHFMTHAFFKALLFLGAGAIIITLHHEHNMFKMGGLRRQLPLIFWTFLMGSASLAALPLVTAGFYSKDMILWFTWSAGKGDPLLWGAGILGAFITGLYTFRMVFVAFFGEARKSITRRPGWKIRAPLIILAILSLTSGFVEIPHNLGGKAFFSDFITTVLPTVHIPIENSSLETRLQVISTLVVFAGIILAYIMYLKNLDLTERIVKTAVGAFFKHFWFSGWGFDGLYNLVFVQPVIWVARINRNDFIDQIYTGVARLIRNLHQLFSRSQTGQMRRYAMAIAFGAILTITVVVVI